MSRYATGRVRRGIVGAACAPGLTMGPLAGVIAARRALGLPRAIDLEPFNPLRS